MLGGIRKLERYSGGCLDWEFCIFCRELCGERHFQSLWGFCRFCFWRVLVWLARLARFGEVLKFSLTKQLISDNILLARKNPCNAIVA